MQGQVTRRVGQPNVGGFGTGPGVDRMIGNTGDGGEGVGRRHRRVGKRVVLVFPTGVIPQAVGIESGNVITRRVGPREIQGEGDHLAIGGHDDGVHLARIGNGASRSGAADAAVGQG